MPIKTSRLFYMSIQNYMTKTLIIHLKIYIDMCAQGYKFSEFEEWRRKYDVLNKYGHGNRSSLQSVPRRLYTRYYLILK